MAERHQGNTEDILEQRSSTSHNGIREIVSSEAQMAMVNLRETLIDNPERVRKSTLIHKPEEGNLAEGLPGMERKSSGSTITCTGKRNPSTNPAHHRHVRPDTEKVTTILPSRSAFSNNAVDVRSQTGRHQSLESARCDVQLGGFERICANTADNQGRKGCQIQRTVPDCDQVILQRSFSPPAAHERQTEASTNFSARGHNKSARLVGGAEDIAPFDPFLDEEGSSNAPSTTEGSGRIADETDRPYPARHITKVPAVWPPAHSRGRRSTGQRRPAPPKAEFIGNRAPTTKELGLRYQEVHHLIQILEGNEDAPPLPDPSTWKLHLKDTTPLNIEEVRKLPTATTTSIEFLENIWKGFMLPDRYSALLTPRTIKATPLSDEDISRAVNMGKFELCDTQRFGGPKLPADAHGVNTFAIPELKGRRRLITEPHLNAIIPKHEVPKVRYPTRLARRQSLRHARYMLQIDFEAFYDSIPIPTSIRDNFVFRTKNWKYYRLCTLPTGARWSVAVGQAITNVIVDIDTPVIIHTLIDNIMIAAKEGQEKEFLDAVRNILSRIRAANLLTSPSRAELEALPDHELLALAEEGNVFLGEEYRKWNGQERLIRNSTKTVAKLQLSLKAAAFTHRTFASLVSLILFALHTTQINPASAFRLLRTYRGIYRQATTVFNWDDPLPFLDPEVRKNLLSIGTTLCTNEWWTIADERKPTYNDHDYDFICYTDASAAGWGAIVQDTRQKIIKTYQQKWIPDFHAEEQQRTSTQPRFNARHSAHAEPRAVHILLKQLIKAGLPDGSKVAVVTDHFPIAHAQKRLNGYGGIGRGYALNKLFEYSYDLLFQRKIQIIYFYLTGKLNPADQLSRHFGGTITDFRIIVKDADDMGLPPLCGARSPLCDEFETGIFQHAKTTRENWK